MEPLSPADVKHWDLGAIRTVFETASRRAGTLRRLGENLDQVHSNLSTWQGEAGEAFRADLGKVRADIEADGAESARVAAAVSGAEADVSACQAELDSIERAAAANGWTITPDWRIDVGDTQIGLDPFFVAAEQQALQDDLNVVKVHAHNTDHELAAAIRAAVGEGPSNTTDGGAGAGGRHSSPQGPRSTVGRAGAGPVGPLPQGPPSTTDGGAGAVGGGAGRTPPSLQDLLLPATGRAEPSGPGGQLFPPGSPLDLLTRLHQPAVSGLPAPRLDPADVESFKAILRKSLASDGVPPDQIEARLDAAVASTQQWLDNGMPHSVAPVPQAAPAPGFGDGFGDRWFATEQGIKNLIGQGGPGAPGVLESWEGLLRGTTQTALNPVGTAVGEVQNAWNSPSPAYYLGGKASDAATTLPGLFFGGGEGAAALRAGEFADLDATGLAHGLPFQQSAPIGFDYPVAYHSWAEQAGLDLNNAFVHGQPTADLSHQVADMSTHYIGDNPDRVVLGKFEGQEGGYIGEARSDGGIYFDTGDDVWNAIGQGLSRADTGTLGWQVNEQFLRTQMENGVGRIDYVLDSNRFSSVEDVVRSDPNSFSAKEIRYLDENAAAYGYERVGNSWVRVKGGQP